MPYKPKKPCGYPGCPELTDGRYCEKHKKQAAQEYNRYQRNPDTYKRFGYRWRKVREAYISKHPLCELCEQQGRLVPAEEVHHIKPWAEGGGDEDDNLQSLCTSCHSRLTLAETRNKYPGGF